MFFLWRILSATLCRKSLSRSAMLIRPARPEDRSAIWGIIDPVIRGGETFTVDPDVSEEEALTYWLEGD